MDLSTKSDAQIAALIDNHLRQGATDRPLYAAALQERSKRQHLDFTTSMSVVEAAAREGRFCAYKDIADANGMDSSRAYRAVPAHLFDLVL